MPRHHHHRHDHRGSMIIPQQVQPFGYPINSSTRMIPVPFPPPYLPNYMPLFIPRTIYQKNEMNPIDNLKNQLNIMNRSRFGGIKNIGIIFVTPGGILFIKNDSNEWTIPYGEKYSYESYNDAVSRIFRENTGFGIDESKKIRETESYDRLRRTGIMAKFYIIYTNFFIIKIYNIYLNCPIFYRRT
jgi:hypothetical protein